MTRITSERKALTYYMRLCDSLAEFERDGDHAAWWTRQRAIWERIEADGPALKDRVMALIMRRLDRRAA